MHACVGSSAELQIATLTVMRQLVTQPTGPAAFLRAQAIPLLAMLQHSLVAEIKTLASNIMNRIAGSSRAAEEAVMEEQQMQVSCTQLVGVKSPSCYLHALFGSIVCHVTYINVNHRALPTVNLGCQRMPE